MALLTTIETMTTDEMRDTLREIERVLTAAAVPAAILAQGDLRTFSLVDRVRALASGRGAMTAGTAIEIVFTYEDGIEEVVSCGPVPHTADPGRMERMERHVGEQIVWTLSKQPYRTVYRVRVQPAGTGSVLEVKP